MTVANESYKTSAVGSGSTGQAVPFNFPITNTSDLKVKSRVTLTGDPTDLVETTDYTVVITGDTGGTLTTVTAVATTAEIHIERDTPSTQSLDLEHGGTFSAENIEDALDKNTKLTIEAKGDAARGIQFPETDPTSSKGDVPNSIDRASRMGGYLANGKPTVSTSTVSEIDAAVGAAVSSTGVLSTSYQFTGNGSDVAFTLTGGLTSIPNSAAVIVDIDGVTQHADTYTVSGLVVTFTTAPPDLSDIQIRYAAYIGTAVDTASGMTYIHPDTGASSRTVQNRLEEKRSSGDYTNLAAAITAIGATVTELHIWKSETLTANATFPSTLAVVIHKGGMIVKASTYTLNFLGPLIAGTYPIFSGFAVTDVDGTEQFVDVEWFGPSRDGSTDDYTAIASAINLGSGAVVKFNRPGTYAVATNIVFVDDTQIIGMPGVILKATASIAAILSQTAATHPTQQMRLEDLFFDGNAKATNCVKLSNISMVQTDAINNIYCTGATGDGIVLQKCQGGSFRNIRSDNNSGHGLSAQGCNGSKFYSITCRSNTESGIEVISFNDGTSYSGGCHWYGVLCETNTEDGMFINGVSTLVSVTGGWIEGNTRDGIRVTDSITSITKLRISGIGTGSNFAINITSSTSVSSIIQGNLLLRASGNTNYPVVNDAGTSELLLGPNLASTGGNIGRPTHQVKSVDFTDKIFSIQANAAGGYIGGGLAVAAAASGGTDTFILTIQTSGGSATGLELTLIGELADHTEGVFKKWTAFAGVGSGIVYDASIAEQYSVGDTLRSTITAGIPVTVSGQAHYTITFTNADNSAFAGFLQIVTYGTDAITSIAVANNQ